MKISDLPDLLIIEEVAELLRVDKQTVKRYIDKGAIKRIKLPSGHVRILKKEIEYLLKEEEKK